MSRKLTYDTWLFGAAMLIVVIGLVMIYSASAIITLQKVGADKPYYFMTRQCVFLIVGGLVMLFLMHIDTRFLQHPRVIATILGGVTLGLLVALFSPTINGTHRWIVVPHVGQMQPSELAKPAVILFLAWWLARREEKVNELTTLIPIATVLGLLAALILREPDFGTAATIVVVAAAMIFTAGIAWRYILLFGMTLIPAAAALAWSAAYRRDRLFTFLNPEADPLGKGFQAMQSLIALGTGGVRGLGIGNGRQKLFFLPEPHTDFIFSIIGEELGFAGAIALIGLFAFVVWRGFRIARYSQYRFEFYAALGFTLLIAVQALVNISVALCLLPTKGLPLPLVSYGGSSLITSMIAVGVLLNLSQQSG
jgi:cell division protein FtsW